MLGALGDDAAAVVWTSHGGQELGHGVADVLTGVAEPYGRLAQAWPEADQDAGDLLDYDVIGGGLTHWYAPRPARWAFGHGLSYTSVAYDAIDACPGIRPGDRPEHRRPSRRRARAGLRRRARAPAARAAAADWSRTAGSGWSPARPRSWRSTCRPTRSRSGT